MNIVNLSDIECITCKHCGSETLPTGNLSHKNLHAHACIRGCVPIQFSSQEPGLYFYKNQLYPPRQNV